MNTTALTDHQLIMAFNSKKTEQSKTFYAFFNDGNHDMFEAIDKNEARRIAREYAIRILGVGLEQVCAYDGDN